MPYCVGFSAREIVATTGRLVQEACHTRSYITAIVNKKIETAGFELTSTAMYWLHRSDTPTRAPRLSSPESHPARNARYGNSSVTVRDMHRTTLARQPLFRVADSGTIHKRRLQLLPLSCGPRVRVDGCHP